MSEYKFWERKSRSQHKIVQPIFVGFSWNNTDVLTGKKGPMPDKISKGSHVTLPTTDLVGTVRLCRGQVVEVQWPDNSVRLHQRRFLIKV